MKINHISESHAIPFSCVLEVLNKTKYGSMVRVMFEMLVITGCRINELNNMFSENLFELESGKHIIYWHVGKNQKGFRKEVLPKKYYEELNYFRETHRCYKNKVFSCNAATFRRTFNKLVRPILSPKWHEKQFTMNNHQLEEEYTLQLKGLRKNYQTLEFAKQFKKWNDAYIALEFTSKKLKHSSKHMTAHHYLENFENLEIEKYANLVPSEIIENAGQLRIMDYLEK